MTERYQGWGLPTAQRHGHENEKSNTRCIRSADLACSDRRLCFFPSADQQVEQSKASLILALQQ
jgi:hypothetical protein